LEQSLLTSLRAYPVPRLLARLASLPRTLSIMSQTQRPPSPRPLALTATLFGLTLYLFTSCKPISRAEGDRILANYRTFYNQTHGIPVRQVAR